MRTKVEFREARIEDVRFLAPRLREADKNEVSALGTDTLTAHPREMLVYGRRKIRELLEEFPVLENWCDARYHAAHRWLKRLGFTLSDPEPHGPHGEEFVKISIRKGD